MARKHLVVEWLSWLPYKSGFINSNILKTSKDRPNTSPSLKVLEQRVHALVGESTEPPSPLDNVVGSKALRSGRVNGHHAFEFITLLGALIFLLKRHIS